MNVYQRLNAAREHFHQLKLNKSGHNKFAGYKYFELGDFLIPALRVFREQGLCATISFDPAVATMTIVNVEEPSQSITITSPLSSAALKGCHEVQNLGAVETYQRRYLWVAALEIVEHDAIDAAEPVKVEAVKPKGVIKATDGADEFVDSARSKTINKMLDEVHGLWEAGKEIPACQAFYAFEWEHEEEKVWAWKELAPYSKLRSLLKANKPQPIAA